MTAAWYEDIHTLEDEVKNNPNVDVNFIWGEALAEAARHCHTQTIGALLTLGANPNLQNPHTKIRNFTPLMWASFYHQPEAVRALVAVTKVNTQCHAGKTALWLACKALE